MEAVASRINSRLTKWNAERGFGFVVADHGDQELFVHVSAFPRDERPPAIGEPLSFEMELDKEGRKRAVRVRRPGAPEPRAPRRQPHDQVRHQASRTPERTESNSFGRRFVALLMVAGLGWYGYTRYTERAEVTAAEPQSVMSSPAQTAAPEIRQPAFQCDGRKHCSQMSSCSEAKQFLNNCTGMEMDGDGDGIPCEQQLCTGPFGG
ncbi:MAG: excalibur calcium-binding domain-containing protein [Hydrogenophaga sp.]|uniref:excalibur calcium-binding domain-containing protein n=1 Tax=Hydrogenophaga sp. TaxID=1904254 RepID=UPI0025BE186E|nr:excalibur calcium-binding domain-containing protein [Hydrogenophaga sp.]MBT9551306.1 excalibur calcium-binding domain-containing protein [Hydrogenophaga sp.]